MQSAFYQRHVSEPLMGAASRLLTQPVLTQQDLIVKRTGMGMGRRSTPESAGSAFDESIGAPGRTRHCRLHCSVGS